MEFYVPYHPDDPKTRLADVLSHGEREEFVAAMLDDVSTAVEEAGHTPVVLATQELDDHSIEHEVRVASDDLTPAVNDVLRTEDPPFGVVVADLPLATAEAVNRLASGDTDVSLAPGIAAGTNAFVVRSSGFRVDYHGTSYLDHLEKAREAGLTVEEVDSYRLAVDVDRPEDVVELLVHGDGRAAEYVDTRFRLVEDEDRRVDVERVN